MILNIDKSPKEITLRKMVKQNSHQKVSPQIKDEALKIAKATQRPGQTKEQTKLIAQGIQKGIEQYKKKQKEKSRELDRKLKQAQKQCQDAKVQSSVEKASETIVYRQQKLPWLLLVLSWIFFTSYLFIMSG